MRPDGRPEGIRQSMSWLHTWSGLLLGWLLYAVFFTGTLSYFRAEIDQWMRPELHRSVPDAQTLERSLETMARLAPGAQSWSLTLPGARRSAVEASWREPGAAQGRAGVKRAFLDAGTGQPIEVRETRGGSFLYRFHFELYAMPRIWGRWIVGVATMMMFVALLSGIVTHRKIFTDFFTFRPRKGQRSWPDAHNATAVLGLPFHLMITFSGLLLFMFQLMPWGVDAVYDGDRRAYQTEVRGGQVAAAAASVPRPTGRRSAEPRAAETVTSEIVPVAPLVEAARQQWPEYGVGGVTVSSPGRPEATIELREGGGVSLADRGRARRIVHDGLTGARIDGPAETASSAVRASYNVLTSAHLGRFSGPALRWLLFLSGLMGTAMVATGLVLWVVKRLPERRKLGRTPFGHRLVEHLNVGLIAGLSIATAAYFWLNRLLPASLEGRADWEIRGFFIVWLLCLIHPLFRRPRPAWREQFMMAALLFAGLPLLNPMTGGVSLAASLAHRQWSLAGFDLAMLALAALHGAIAWWLGRAVVAQGRARPGSGRLAMVHAPQAPERMP